MTAQVKAQVARAFRRRGWRPTMEGLEARLALSASPRGVAPPGYVYLLPNHRPVTPPAFSLGVTSFTDPSCQITPKAQ